MRRLEARIALSLAGVAALTLVSRAIPANATTAGFGYLLLVLAVASSWGFTEALATSIAAALGYNVFFFPPIGTFTIADTRNWVALLSFLATAVIASRLHALARLRELEARRKQRDLERLYSFSRGILSIAGPESFPQQLVRKVAETFELRGAVLYLQGSGEFYRAGEALDITEDQLRESAADGKCFADPQGERHIAAVRLGTKPVASIALGGGRLSPTVVDGIGNLVAIGLERARAQDLAHQMEAARRSEHLRTALLDAMAHEFKTPLTSIKAATTSLLSAPAQSEADRIEMLRIADEAADRLESLIDDAIDMARLNAPAIDIQPETADLAETVEQVISSMKAEIENGRIEVAGAPAQARFDRRLVKLAVKQLVDNALKYSQPDTPVRIRIENERETVRLDVTNQGQGIPEAELGRIFDRFYRSPGVVHQIPGSGLGLSIAQRIARAHHGDITVNSTRGETTFRLTLPATAGEESE